MPPFSEKRISEMRRRIKLLKLCHNFQTSTSKHDIHFYFLSQKGLQRPTFFVGQAKLEGGRIGAQFVSVL